MKYVFDPEVVHECALAAIGLPKPAMFDAFADALEARYPGMVDRGQPWIYSIAGGTMIQMKLYFASVCEYVMVWGTPIGSEGHSGRHLVGFWDTVIDGEARYYGEGQFEKSVYVPGDRIYVGPGQARAMNFANGVWAVEYARGPIPTSLPFGLADVVLSCLDWQTAVRTVSLYADLVTRAWARIHAPSVPVVGQALKATLEAVGAGARRVTMALEPPPELPGIPTDLTHTVIQERKRPEGPARRSRSTPATEPRAAN